MKEKAWNATIAWFIGVILVSIGAGLYSGIALSLILLGSGFAIYAAVLMAGAEVHGW